MRFQPLSYRFLTPPSSLSTTHANHHLRLSPSSSSKAAKLAPHRILLPPFPPFSFVLSVLAGPGLEEKQDWNGHGWIHLLASGIRSEYYSAPFRTTLAGFVSNQLSLFHPSSLLLPLSSPGSRERLWRWDFQDGRGNRDVAAHQRFVLLLPLPSLGTSKISPLSKEEGEGEAWVDEGLGSAAGTVCLYTNSPLEKPSASSSSYPNEEDGVLLSSLS